MYIKQCIKRLACCVFLITTYAHADTTINLITNSDFANSSVPSGSTQWETDDGFWAAAWLFADINSGIANSDSSKGGEAATNTVAILASNGGTDYEGSTTQFISSEADDFSISFKLAQGTYGGGTVDVYFDNKRIATDLKPSDFTFETYNLTVTDAIGVVHFISFRATTQGDSVFLDDVIVIAEH